MNGNNEVRLDVKVACACCRGATGTHMIKDCGMKVYPVCRACLRSCVVREVAQIVVGK